MEVAPAEDAVDGFAGGAPDKRRFDHFGDAGVDFPLRIRDRLGSRRAGEMLYQQPRVERGIRDAGSLKARAGVAEKIG